MTTASPNLHAAGGKIWQPQKTAKNTTKRILKGLLDYSIVIIFFLLILASAALIIIKATSLPVEVTSITTSSIQLSHAELNPGSAQEKIKTWIPTALGVDETQVRETLLTSTLNGTKGTITLANGDIIPFTLHNDDNQTFTVTKG